MEKYRDWSFAEIVRRLRHYGLEQTLFTKMAAIKPIHDITDRQRKLAYCLLELDIKRGRNKVYVFEQNQFGLANEMYTKAEQSSLCVSGDVNVVLISTEQLDQLQNLYPSYFLDVSRFMGIIAAATA